MLKRRVSLEELDPPEKRQRIESEAANSIPDAGNQNLASQSEDMDDFDLDAIIAGAVAHVAEEYQTAEMGMNGDASHHNQQNERTLSTVSTTQIFHPQSLAPNDSAASIRLSCDHQLSLQVLSLLSLESLVCVFRRLVHTNSSDIKIVIADVEHSV